MKKTLIALAVLGSAAGHASAQSNVTLYGVFDTAFRNSTNVNANGDSQLQLNAGLIQGSRWGVRGTEDLGGGMKAIFDLQSGFNPTTGTSGQQGQLFGRQAWVGLDAGFGKLTFGRQFGVAFDAFGAFDPYGIGNASAISAPQLDVVGARFNNTAKYQKKFGAVALNLAYSLGETVGNTSTGSTAGVGVDFAPGSFTLNSAYQQSTDVNSRKSAVYVFGGTYPIGSVKLYAGYTHNTRDQGFATCAGNNATSLGATVPAACVSGSNPNGINGALSNTNLAPGSTIGNGKTDLYLLGAMVDVTSQFQLVAAYMQNNTRINGAPDARHRTAYAVADYYFTKRTDVYFSVDHTSASNFTGGYDSFANGNRPTTGIMLGVRHRF